jgi:omega-amidase
METAMKTFKLALIQMLVTSDKAKNLSTARRLVLSSAKEGAKVIVLPECFNSPYGTQYFAEYAEELSSSETRSALSAMAKETSTYLVGGSFPERSGSNLYNTCLVHSPSGELLSKYRKVHLFDISIPSLFLPLLTPR